MTSTPWDDRAEALAGLGTWTIDLDSGRMTSNRTVRTLLGWAADAPEPTLADYFAAVHPQDRDELQRHWRQLRREGVEYDVEHRLLLPSGAVKHMRAVACAARDETGRVHVLHGITQDVTTRRLAELETERQRDRSRAVLGSLHEGFLLTRDGVILEVNDALCSMTGFAEEELRGARTPYPFWPPDDVPAPLSPRDRVTAGPSGSAEVEIARKDGSRLAVAMTATCLPGEGGPPTWVMVLRDVTAQHEYERLLEARAASDPLTGVLNSRAFREELRSACTTPGDAPVTLALFDVDHFKAINDRHGHAVGDQVLIALVERLRTATAGTGTLARVGGEEFALVLRGTDVVVGRRVVAAALEALRTEPVAVVGTLTASAGVAQLLPGMDDDALFRLADRRLYEAKAQGRDQVR